MTHSWESGSLVIHIASSHALMRSPAGEAGAPGILYARNAAAEPAPRGLPSPSRKPHAEDRGDLPQARLRPRRPGCGRPVERALEHIEGACAWDGPRGQGARGLTEAGEGAGEGRGPAGGGQAREGESGHGKRETEVQILAVAVQGARKRREEGRDDLPKPRVRPRRVPRLNTSGNAGRDVTGGLWVRWRGWGPVGDSSVPLEVGGVEVWHEGGWGGEKIGRVCG